MLPAECLNNSAACLKALHSTADLWFGRLLLATKIVAIGLILEAPELGYDVWAIVRRQIDKRKHRGTSPESHVVPDWAKVIAFVGWILIVGGVVGEWFSEGKVNNADTSIQELNDTLLKEAVHDAGAAKTSATEAKGAATEAEQTVGTVQKEADDLLHKYLETSREVAKYALRTVSSEQLRVLRRQLQPVRGRAIVVRWNTEDPEQDNFGSQLADALQKSGLVVSPIFGEFKSGGGYPRPITPPIALEDVTKDNSDLAGVLANALIAAALAKPPVATRPPGNIIIGGDDLKVVVGPKSPN